MGYVNINNVIFIGILLSTIKMTVSKCSKVCEWDNWRTWTSCSVSCGGGGRQHRSRSLCCKQDWSARTCAENCHVSKDGYNEYRNCGDTCKNGGKVKIPGYRYGCNCFDRAYGYCCENRLPGCTPYPTDVIFILDSSLSQTKEQFAKQLEFVKMFVMHMNVSYYAFQVALITFATEAKVEIWFNSTYFGKEALLNMISEIKFRPGATFTNKGLQLAMTVHRNSERRQGMATMTYAFVLTDGMSNKRSETKEEAFKLKRSGVKVISIGIGEEVSHQELSDISSPGDSYNPSYVFTVVDFNALDTLLKQLVQVTCNDCSTINHMSDIVFLLDESKDMSETEFELSIDVMTSIIQTTKHIGKTNGPAFGLVRLGESLTPVINISDNLQQSSLTLKLQALNRHTHMFCDEERYCTGTNITSAIRQTIDEFFKEKRRQNSRKILIVLSNGKFGNSNMIKEEINEIRDSSNVKMFVIGPGPTVDMNGLLSLARDAYHVFVCLDKDDTIKLNVIQSEFSYNNCKKN